MKVKTKVFSQLCNGFVSCFQSLGIEFSFIFLLTLWLPSHGYLFTLSLGVLWSSSLSHPLIVQDMLTCKDYLLWKIVGLEKGTSKFIFSTFKFKRQKRRVKLKGATLWGTVSVTASLLGVRLWITVIWMIGCSFSHSFIYFVSKCMLSVCQTGTKKCPSEYERQDLYLQWACLSQDDFTLRDFYEVIL